MRLKPGTRYIQQLRHSSYFPALVDPFLSGIPAFSNTHPTNGSVLLFLNCLYIHWLSIYLHATYLQLDIHVTFVRGVEMGSEYT